MKMVTATEEQLARWRARVADMMPSDGEILAELEERWKARPRNGMTVQAAIDAERGLRATLAAVTVIQADGVNARQRLICLVTNTRNGSVSFRLDKLQAAGLVHATEDRGWTLGNGRSRKHVSVATPPSARTISKPEFDPGPDLSGDVTCPWRHQRWHSPDRFRIKYHDGCRPRHDGAMVIYEMGSLTGGGRRVNRGRS